MKFLKHILASMSKLSSMYSNQLVTPIESTMFERICQLSYSLTIFIHLPRSLNYTSNYLNFNIEYKDRAIMSHKKMHTIKSLEANNILKITLHKNNLIYSIIKKLKKKLLNILSQSISNRKLLKQLLLTIKN